MGKKVRNSNEEFAYAIDHGKFKEAIELIQKDDFDPNYTYTLDKELGITGTAMHTLVWSMGGYSQDHGENVMTTVMHELIKKGVNPDQQGSLEVVPLELAVSYDFFETAKLLLENGANPNAHKYTAYGALSGAILNDNIPMFDLLVQHGASEQAKDQANITLLEMAYEVNNPAFVSRLISKGVDVNEPFMTVNGNAVSFKDRIIADVMGKESKNYSGEEKRNKRAILKLIQEFEKKEKGQESEFGLLKRMYDGKRR